MHHFARLTFAVLTLLLFLVQAPPAAAQYETVKIVRYSVAQFSTSNGASIDLFNGRGQQVAILNFMPVSADELPAAAKGLSDGVIRLYYTRDRLHDVVDQLRNGTGVVLRFWLGIEPNSHIASTKPELVGAGAP